MKKATFANGVVLYYDEEKHALPTHFGDADGVQHELVTLEAAADDEEVRYVEPGGSGTQETETPAEDKAEAGTAPDARDAEIADLKARLAAAETHGDFVPSG